MKILKLTINNFLSFKNAEIFLNNRGLVAIQGENLDDEGADSNGSGKSSLFIAIRWCLYGETEKKISSDEVINSVEGKDCFVEALVLDETNGIKYLITRYRKHSKHKDKLVFKVKHPKSTEWLDETRGKNTLTQTQINKSLGMDHDIFMASCFASQEDAVDIPAMKDTELKILLENALPFETLNNLYSKYKSKLDEVKPKLIKLEKELEYTNSTIFTKLDGLSLTVLEETKFLGDQEGNLKDLEDKIRKTKDNILKLNESLVDKLAVRKTINQLRDKEKELNGDQSETVFNWNRVIKQREALQAQLAKLGGASACPVCKQPVEASMLAEHTTEIQANIDTNELEYFKLDKRLQELRDNQPKVEKIRSAVESLELKISNSNIVQREIEILENFIKDYEEKIKLFSSNPFEETIKIQNKQVLDLQNSLITLTDQLKNIKEEVEVLEAMVEIFGPKGYRYHLLESITPELNAKTNEYLTMLTDGKIRAIWSTVTKLKSGEYKEAFSIKVNKSGRTNYGSLSGGQKRKVKLACWFALQDLVSARAAKDFKLWVCDEVDGALDKSGIERLMSLLEEKARTRETVLVISHNNLKDWIANNTTVSMKDDVSTVNGYLIEDAY